MYILHSYTDVRPLSQIDTLHAMIEIARMYGPDFVSRYIYKEDDTAYHRFLLDYWDREWGNIINIEQDIVPSPRMINELLECPYFLCCFPYRLQNGELSVGYPDDELTWKSYGQVPEYADFSGLGLTKFSPTARHSIDLGNYPVDQYKWWFLDTWIYKQLHMRNLKYHVHSPEVPHNRNKEY